MIKLTGASGMLGSRLLFDLASTHQSIGILIRDEASLSRLKQNLTFYTNQVEALCANFKIYYGDITDYQSVEDFLDPGDKVFHCAAMVSFNTADKEAIEWVNIEGTANLVNAALIKGVSKLCHTSSIGALGRALKGIPSNESNFYEGGPKSTYSKSKFLSEMEVWRGIAEGLNAVIVNPAVIIGEGNWHQGSGRLFKMVNQGMPFYTLGSTAYVDVSDVTKAMMGLMDSEVTAERFILASENLTYRDFFKKVALSINAKPPRWYASRTVTGIAWRASSVWSKITGSSPKFTKQTHRISHGSDAYDGSKICSAIKFTYMPIDESITRIGQAFVSTYRDE